MVATRDHEAELRPLTSATPYSGRENLEAMEGARNYNSHLLQLVKREATEGLVIDFGAGIGTFARPMRDSGYEVLCVEPDAELRRALTDGGLDAVATLETVADASVAYIYSLNVLEHIRDDGAVIEQLRRRLVPGGKLLLYVPAFNLLHSAMDLRVGHFRRYRKRALREKLEAAGFEIQSARYADSIGFVATLAYKAFGDKTGVIGTRGVAFYDRWLFPLSRVTDMVLGRWLGKNLVIVARATLG